MVIHSITSNCFDNNAFLSLILATILLFILILLVAPTNIFQHSEFMMPTSQNAIVFTCLAHLHGVRTRAQFIVGLLRGLSANLSAEGRLRDSLAQEVYRVYGISPPDAARPQNVRVKAQAPDQLVTYPTGLSLVLSRVEDESRGPTGGVGLSNRTQSPDCLEIEREVVSPEDPETAVVIADSLAENRPPIVLTPEVRREVDAFLTWIDGSGPREPVLIIGPEDCGKT
ncbi:unnamed protein product [Protopolystoma xenopodis]|uniref:Cytoplasmic dynein 2 heavy chain 1 AAA+ ATPase domain-containing protein n=1 Tax=Protopolystoma xenopodis TaxID=117903 RepID=A0A3S5ABE9_9PLAT|nr:unnamed protein product [Protopolystoma xenopodis]